MTTDTGKTALRELRDWIAEGTFVLDAMPWPHEVTAYNAFSGSLDAATALHEALLPGWFWEVSDDAEVTLMHSLGAGHGHVHIEPSNRAPSKAWLLAQIDALIQEATDDA